jgi:molecular chaperone HscB
VSHVPAPDPFAVFGLPRSLELDAAALEKRYLALSRGCHPDHNRAEDAIDCAAVLLRAAEINDAFRVLRDRWQRARSLIEAECPGALERNKALDPVFLVAALELAEQVATVDRDAVEGLRCRLQRELEDDYTALRAAVEAAEFDAAAVRFHQAHYHRKALADLEARV